MKYNHAFDDTELIAKAISSVIITREPPILMGVFSKGNKNIIAIKGRRLMC